MVLVSRHRNVHGEWCVNQYTYMCYFVYLFTHV